MGHLKKDESNQRFRNIIEQAINPILILKGEDLILEIANEPLLKIWGVTKDAIGKPFLEILPSMKDQPFRELMLNVLRTGVPYYGHEQPAYFNHPNGEIVTHYFDFVFQPYREIDGLISGVLIIAVEVTKRVLAAKAIKENEQQFSLLANNVQNLAWMANADGWIYWYNNRWYEYTGTTPEQMEGWGWQSVHDPEQLPAVLEKWKSSINTGQPFDMVFPLRGADNLFRPFLTRVMPVKNNEGDVIRWVGTNTDITEQKIQKEDLEKAVHERTLQLESYVKQLKSSEAQVQAILLYAPDAVITIDESGVVTSWNPQAESIFGWKENEVIGKTLTDTIIPLRYREQHTMGMKNFLQTGHGPVINKPIEIFAVKKDKSEIPVELKISYSKINDSYLFIGFVRDISIRNQVQEILLNKTTQLIEAQQLAHIGSWEWNVPANKIEWSDELYRIYGLFPQEFEATYENYLKYIHPDDREHVNETVQSAFKDHQPFHFIHNAICADGNVKVISATGKVFTDSNGNTVRMAGTAQDITAQKEQEQKIIEANESLQRKNQEIALSKYNKRFLTEFSERFSSYKPHDEFFHSLVLYIADLTKMDYVLIGKLQQTSENVFVIQTIAITANGSLVPNISYPLPDGPCEQVIRGTLYSYPENCRITFPKNQTLVKFNVEGYIGYPLFDGQGNAIGLIAVMHENGIEDPETVTSILKIVAKRAEIEFEQIKYEAELEQKNKILEEKNITLEKMNKELESFAYVSSHDLQEPLRKIQTFSSRILENENEKLSNTVKNYLNRMQDAAQRMQQLIQDLLEYSRTSTSERNFEKTDLNIIIEEVKSEFKEAIEEKHAIIEVKKSCEVNIIPFQFRQLMHNLISNALKFSNPKTPPYIIINCLYVKSGNLKISNLPPSKEYCHISITDNGIGFEKRFSKKIFEIFQRLHSDEKYAGTGIGLSIVKKIVDNHNGIITATSELNKGTTFDIYIPV